MVTFLMLWDIVFVSRSSNSSEKQRTTDDIDAIFFGCIILTVNCKFWQIFDQFEEVFNAAAHNSNSYLDCRNESHEQHSRFLVNFCVTSMKLLCDSYCFVLSCSFLCGIHLAFYNDDIIDSIYQTQVHTRFDIKPN